LTLAKAVSILSAFCRQKICFFNLKKIKGFFFKKKMNEEQFQIRHRYLATIQEYDHKCMLKKQEEAFKEELKKKLKEEQEKFEIEIQRVKSVYILCCRNKLCNNEVPKNDEFFQYCSAECLKMNRIKERDKKRKATGYNPICKTPNCGKPRATGQFCSVLCRINYRNEYQRELKKEKRKAKKKVS
jgi:hypothetical protein